MISTNLDHTLEKYLKGQSTPGQSFRLDLWLKTMRINGYHGEDIGRNDEEQLNNFISHDCRPDEITGFHPKYSNPSSIVKSRNLLIAITSLTMLFLTCVFYENNVNSHAPLTSQNNIVDKILLPDGTIAILSNDSKLVYSESTIRHRIFFSGEGLFEKPEAEVSPLLINCKRAFTRISGVAFIKATEHGVKVQVLKGCAELLTSDRIQSVRAGIGQQMELKADGSIEVLSADRNDIPNVYLSEYL
ncbi:MAG: hypothetical protein ABIS36_11430 [Chryseolinea sp.]